MCKSIGAFSVGLLAVIALFGSGVSAATFKDCADANAIGSYSKVEVNNCKEDQPTCTLKRDSNATISITFKSTEELKDLKAVVHGVIMDMPIPFKLPNDNGCVDSGLECPLAKDTDHKYVATLPVLKQYPKVRVDVKWELISDSKTVVCVVIPAKIQ